MDDSRPDPEQLLKKIKETEAVSKKGKLKIFFGYAAGVGKTYAMLDDARAVKKDGIDAVIGYVEPHARPETLALMEGFESIPMLAVDYKGIKLKEFDLDASLKRRPQLILVDELAHTNASSCRNSKRYLDIEELLREGIDVYTTINVQHLESLNDIVASITQVTVQERIPDEIFDRADQVELVDIEPDALVLRLEAGKIYHQIQARKALSHFFSKDNLVALREIALRRTADRVNRGANENRLSKKGEYYTEEHILICLSSAPSNTKVIRNAARMATAFNGLFTALFVETANSKHMNDTDKKRLADNLKLAEQLGARIATVYGDDLPFQIAEYAKSNGVSKIVIGRTNHKLGGLRYRATLLDRLTGLAPNIDIYIIPDRQPAYKRKIKLDYVMNEIPPSDWGKLALVMVCCTLIGLLFYYNGISESNIITVYILGILIISSQTASRWIGVFSSLCGVLTYNYFFTNPKYTFQAYGVEYPITFLIMLISALITSTLTIRVRTQAKEFAMNAHRTQVLLETSQKLQNAKNFHEIVQGSIDQLLKLLDRTIIFYIVVDGSLDTPVCFHPANGEIVDKTLTASDEKAVAAWAMRNRKPAGARTDTLPGARAWYTAIGNSSQVFAVLGVKSEEGKTIDPFEKNLLASMIGQISLVFEKYFSSEAQKEANMQAAKERLRSNLLRAISHDLRTPLTSISGNASMLMESESRLDITVKKHMYEDIYDDSMWLINLVENLLSVTRIDNGTMRINMLPEMVEDIISEAMLHINRKKSEHKIIVHIYEELMMARVDARLIIQVIINIVDNAIKYTDPGSEIMISAFVKKDKVIVEIADSGKGIPARDKEKLFDMFFTAVGNHGDNRRGLGLGLSLCKSIIDAHNGEISVRDNKPHGTIFHFTLEHEEVHMHE